MEKLSVLNTRFYNRRRDSGSTFSHLVKTFDGIWSGPRIFPFLSFSAAKISSFIEKGSPFSLEPTPLWSPRPLRNKESRTFFSFSLCNLTACARAILINSNERFSIDKADNFFHIYHILDLYRHNHIPYKKTSNFLWSVSFPIVIILPVIILPTILYYSPTLR